MQYPVVQPQKWKGRQPIQVGRKLPTRLCAVLLLQGTCLPFVALAYHRTGDRARLFFSLAVALVDGWKIRTECSGVKTKSVAKVVV